MVLLRPLPPDSHQPVVERSRVVQARFDDARQVYLLGPFNNWSTTATPMTPVGRDLWIARVPESTSDAELSFFVWRFNARFGRILRNEPTATG
jgi:hypothetical protein